VIGSLLCGDMHQSFADTLVKWFSDIFPMFADSSLYSLRCPRIRRAVEHKMCSSNGICAAVKVYLCSEEMSITLFYTNSGMYGKPNCVLRM